MRPRLICQQGDAMFQVSAVGVPRPRSAVPSSRKRPNLGTLQTINRHKSRKHASDFLNSAFVALQVVTLQEAVNKDKKAQIYGSYANSISISPQNFHPSHAYFFLNPRIFKFTIFMLFRYSQTIFCREEESVFCYVMFAWFNL